jgi:hypothetical protein
MDPPTWFLMTVVFVVSWLLIPAIILHYRLTSVVHRYKEVLDAFFWRGVSNEKIQNRSVPLEDLSMAGHQIHSGDKPLTSLASPHFEMLSHKLPLAQSTCYRTLHIKWDAAAAPFRGLVR